MTQTMKFWLIQLKNKDMLATVLFIFERPATLTDKAESEPHFDKVLYDF